MTITNLWLGGLSLTLATLGYLRHDQQAINIGLLCALSVALAGMLLPKHTPNAASAFFLFLHRLYGWVLILIMTGAILHYATDGLSTALLTFAWRYLI